MTRFARGWIAAVSMAIWLGASTALYAQSGATNNPLRGNPPTAGNQPTNNPPAYNPPRVAQQPGQGVQQPQAPQGNQINPNGQNIGGGQPNYGGQQSPGNRQPANGQVQPGGGVLPNQAPIQPIALPLQAPFVLTPQEQTDLDKLLAQWEAESDKVKTFSCLFTRLIYDPVWVNGNNNQPKSMDKGEIKYAAPDRGMFRVDESFNFVFNQQAKNWNQVKAEITDYWTCSGTSIYTVDYKNKIIQEHQIPKEMQGKAISDGPLPFVFGAKADALKKRYYMKLNNPPGVANEVWLDVYPKFRADAQNFSHITLILSKDEMLPKGMQMFDPGAKANNQSRTVILFEKHSVNNAFQKLKGWFSDFSIPDIFGFKHVVVPQSAPAAPQAQPPAQVQNPGGAQPQQRQAAVPQMPPKR